MADTATLETRGLLNRIAAFRERLEQQPYLLPDGPATKPEDAQVFALRITADPDRFATSLKKLAGAETRELSTPPVLTQRATKLLQEARELISRQRTHANLPALQDDTNPLAVYHRRTVALTEAALRQVQSFPDAPDVQLRLCEGLEAMLGVVRDRLTTFDRTIAVKKNDDAMVARLTELYLGLIKGGVVELSSFQSIAEFLIDEANQGTALRFIHSALPGDARGVATCVAVHAINCARVMARLSKHDFEWERRPVPPVLGCLLMDLGMVRVPAGVWSRVGVLDAAERRLMEKHARDSADIIRVKLPEAIGLAEAIAAHHERQDGTGYPMGLKAAGVPTLARFLAVVDCYTAMLSPRPHRQAMDPRVALTETLLLAERGLLDKDFAEYLLHLSFYPVGTVVELTDGRLATVIANHSSLANLRATARPVVAILTDADGKVLPRPEHRDLAIADRGGIVRALPLAEKTDRLATWYPELCW